MTKTLDAIQMTIKKHLPQLRDDFHVSKIGIFGSFVRGDDNENSDIDMLVDFTYTPGLFQFVKLEKHLGKILGRKVDLVTKAAIKSAIRKQILQETVYV